jgi:hypothetical protein
MARESARTAVSLAGSLELVPGEGGVMHGRWRGAPYEVDELGRLRVRAVSLPVSARMFFHLGRGPRLEVEHENPLLAQALTDCLERSPLRAWLSSSGARLNLGWLEQPLPASIDAARETIEGALKLAPELERVVDDALRLARDHAALAAQEAEQRELSERLLAPGRLIARFAKRRAWAKRSQQLWLTGGLTLFFGVPMFAGSQPSTQALGLLAALAIGAMVLGRLGIYLLLRCPSCDQSMRRVRAQNCPGCGSRLEDGPPGRAIE